MIRSILFITLVLFITIISNAHGAEEVNSYSSSIQQSTLTHNKKDDEQSEWLDPETIQINFITTFTCTVKINFKKGFTSEELVMALDIQLKRCQGGSSSQQKSRMLSPEDLKKKKQKV